eukprot:477828-Alexandrium_andersonii.AAC.1
MLWAPGRENGTADRGPHACGARLRPFRHGGCRRAWCLACLEAAVLIPGAADPWGDSVRAQRRRTGCLRGTSLA